MFSRNHRVLVALGAVLTLLPTWAAAQSGTTVSGRVTSDAGTPLSNASVFVQGMNVGTLTKPDGSYSFTVPAGRATGQTVTLTARLIGYTPNSAQITLSGGEVTHDFVLAATAVQLQGVVTTALGITREKSELGTAQQQLTSAELNQTRTQNLINQIQGKVSGVQITGAGTPGGSTNVIIRGQNSIAGNNQPLFVVDGVPVSNANRGGSLGNGYDYGNAISDLNPDDIETFSVLKGPNAAALYGSQAANGVIVITTKKGTPGGIRTEVNTFYTWDTPSKLPDFQNLYGQGAGGEFQFVNGAGRGNCDGCDQSWGPRLDGRLIDQFTGKQQPWVAHPDNVKDFFQTGHSFTSTIAVSGGGERANARLSVGTDQISGYVPNNSFQKMSALLSGTLQVNSRLSTDATLQYIANKGRNRPGTGYGNSIMEQFFWFGRQIDLDALKNYQQGGAANNGPATREFNWNYNYHNNPFWLQYENPRRDTRDRFIGSLSASYRLLDWLNATARTGSDIYRFDIEQRFARGYLNSTYVNTAYAGGFNFIDDYRNDNNSSVLLTADRDLLNRLRLQATAGGAIRSESFNTASTQSNAILVPGTFNVSNSAVNPTLGQEKRRRQVNSVYGSAAFTFDGWWTVEGTARNDWSSTLPKNANSYFYPSVNTSLVLTDALPSLKTGVVSYLKLRGSIAKVGNDADPYQLQTVFAGVSNKFNGLPQFTLGDVLANAQLKPEITRSDEVGIEVGLFNGRANLDATYYTRNTRNQTFNVPISPASGFFSKAINAGRIQNKGFEALLSVIPLQMRHGLHWNSTFSFARNQNLVAELYPGISTIILGNGLFGELQIQARAGRPYGTIWNYGYARDEQGRILVQDGLPLSGDTLRDLGSMQPKWTGGWSNTFTFRNFSLNALLDIRHGGKLVSYTNAVGEYSGVLKSSLKGREVDFDTPGVTVQGIDIDTGQPNTKTVTAEEYFQGLFLNLEPYVYDGSYVKLREVRLGFDVPTRWANRFYARSLSLALVGRNLWFDAKAPNIDPEFAYSSGNFQGVEYAFPSNPRSIGLSVRLTP